MDALSVGQSLDCTSPPLSCPGHLFGGRIQNQLTVELPSSLTDAWYGAYSSSDGPAVVTVGWVADVAVLAILLTHDRVPVALGLDPSQRLVADALRQWSKRAMLALTHRQGDEDLVLEVGVHIDAVVSSLMLSCDRAQGSADFRRAVAAYSDMEYMLSRLAGTRRIRWAVGWPTAALAGARLSRPLHAPQGGGASPAC